MLLLTWRDIQYRAIRFVVVIVGTSVVFALLLLMTGLTAQFSREPRQTVDALGAEGWLLRDGSSGAFTSAATLDPAVAGRVHGARRVAAVVTARHSLSSAEGPVDIVVIGHHPGNLGSPIVTAGRRVEAEGEAVIDESAEVAVGDRLEIGDTELTVVGLSRDTTLFAGMPLVFMTLDDSRNLVYRGQPVATALLVEGQPDTIPEGFVILGDDAIVEDAMRPLERSISSVNLIRILLWLVAAMIIGSVAYLSALERTRDFAVLKAVGLQTRTLLGGLALQSALIALLAALVAAGLQALLVPVFPLRVYVETAALVQVPAVATVVALLAAAGGMRRVIQVDPALAFTGAGA